jgi:hypothetical protein
VPGLVLVVTLSRPARALCVLANIPYNRPSSPGIAAALFMTRSQLHALGVGREGERAWGESVRGLKRALGRKQRESADGLVDGKRRVRSPRCFSRLVSFDTHRSPFLSPNPCFRLGRMSKRPNTESEALIKRVRTEADDPALQQIIVASDGNSANKGALIQTIRRTSGLQAPIMCLQVRSA